MAVKTDSRDARLTDIFDAAVKRGVKDPFKRLLGQKRN